MLLGALLGCSHAPPRVGEPGPEVKDAQREAAETLYQQCLEAGIDTLLDDRAERAGVKFKDAELIGVPYRLTLGKKLSEGLVELSERSTRQSTDVRLEEAPMAVKQSATKPWGMRILSSLKSSRDRIGFLEWIKIMSWCT